MPNITQLKNELQKLANPKTKVILERFFKTCKGEYGEGDIFLGIKVGPQRQLAKKYKDLRLVDVIKLLHSEYHEARMAALFILIFQFVKVDEQARKKIFNSYLINTRYINNWDLVDLSAPNIVGVYLLDKPRQVLYKLAKSKNLWERRIAIMATFSFIRDHQYSDSLKIAKILLHDEHDLIHKAVGWMLREVGKRDIETEEKFLQKYYKKMPRTMLRYAIERFPEKKRKYYSAKK